MRVASRLSPKTMGSIFDTVEPRDAKSGLVNVIVAPLCCVV
jgi:hypothetical protein